MYFQIRNGIFHGKSFGFQERRMPVRVRETACRPEDIYLWRARPLPLPAPEFGAYYCRGCRDVE